VTTIVKTSRLRAAEAFGMTPYPAMFEAIAAKAMRRGIAVPDAT
jgi:hypothetical protein